MDGWIDEQSKDYVSLLNEMIDNSFIVIPLFALVLACAFTGIVPGLLLVEYLCCRKISSV